MQVLRWLIHLLFFSLCFVSCKNEVTETTAISNEPEVVATNGYVIPNDSITEPIVVPAGKPESVTVDHSFSVPAANNIFPAAQPKIIPAGKPYVAKPGTAIYEAAVVREVKDTVVPCVHSEPTLSQRPRFKDEASCNIQYLDVDQGLPNSYVHMIYEDRQDNIWFSTTTMLTKYDGKSFSNFTEKEGFLGARAVKALYSDSKGNMWMGSGRGACKYDGNTFTYYHEENGWPGKYVKSIIEDKKGNIWFASDKGISFYDGKKFTCFSEKQGLIDDNALCLLSDKLGNIWVGTDAEISKYDGSTFVSYTKEEGLISNRIVSIAEDKKGDIWMSSIGGVCKFNGSSFEHYTQKEGLLNSDNRNLIVDKAGNVWITCYGGGITKFDGKNFSHFTEKEGLTLNIVWCTMEDRAGNIWIGTDGGGVCKYMSRSFSHFTEKQGMGKTVMSVFEDTDKNLWIGGYASGLWKYDGKTFTLFNGKATGTVRQTLQDKSGNLWFACEGAGLLKKNGSVFELYSSKQGLINDHATALLEDKEGNLWIGSNAGLNKFNGKNFTHYTTKQGLCSDNVSDLLQDRNGHIWITTSKGVNKFDGKSMVRFTEKEGLSINSVRNILEDRNGTIWIGTNGGGLNKFDGKLITKYSEKEGLSNNFVRSIIEDKPENLPEGMIGLWLSTDNGIDHLLIGNKKFSDSDTSIQELKINIYKREDGLKGEDFTSNSGYQDSKSRIWWGSVKSLTMLDASNVIDENEIPQIKMDNIKLQQKFIDFRSLKDSIAHNKNWFVDEKHKINLSKINFTDVPLFFNYPINMELPFNINNIEFNFSSNDWIAPHKLRYQFILEGADKDWHPVTQETKAVYTSLGSGDYTFKVKAKGFSDIWSEPFEYHFVIQPPWWKTVWAYSFYFLCALLCVFLIFKWRTKALLTRQKELELTIKERTADVVLEKNNVVEKNRIIEDKQKEIIDSIQYARRIQNSLMPTEKYIDSQLKRLKGDDKKE